MGEIIFNGRSSKELGLEVETFPTYESPKRTYEKIHIPGRNGDLLIDGGSWENVTRTYAVSIGSHRKDYTSMINGVMEWLHSTTSYARLEDSYERDYFRYAVFNEALAFSNLFNHGGKANIGFDCKPQRFLKIGEDPITITSASGVKIQNPTNFPALPLLHIQGINTGRGTVTIGDYSVQFEGYNGEVYLDCDSQDAYLGAANKNPTLTVLGTGIFPRIDPGIIGISYSGNITKLEVIPRWYTI